MAVFEIIEGQPGNGKSLYTAKIVQKLVKRNIKWFERSGVIRPIYSNLKFTPEFEQSSIIEVVSENDGEQKLEKVSLLRYWLTVDEVSKLRDCDLIWDEIATEMDARTFASLSDEIKRFLSQYDKEVLRFMPTLRTFLLLI